MLPIRHLMYIALLVLTRAFVSLLQSSRVHTCSCVCSAVCCRHIGQDPNGILSQQKNPPHDKFTIVNKPRLWQYLVQSALI